MENVLDDCLAQCSSKNVLKKSSTSMVWVYWAGAKACCGGSSRTGFG